MIRTCPPIFFEKREKTSPGMIGDRYPCTMEQPVCPGNFCHAPGLGNASPWNVGPVTIKDLGDVPHARFPQMMENRDKHRCNPFPGHTIPQERFDIICSEPGPDAPVVITPVSRNTALWKSGFLTARGNGVRRVLKDVC